MHLGKQPKLISVSAMGGFSGITIPALALQMLEMLRLSRNSRLEMILPSAIFTSGSKLSSQERFPMNLAFVGVSPVNLAADPAHADNASVYKPFHQSWSRKMNRYNLVGA